MEEEEENDDQAEDKDVVQGDNSEHDEYLSDVFLRRRVGQLRVCFIVSALRVLLWLLMTFMHVHKRILPDALSRTLGKYRFHVANIRPNQRYAA